MESYKELREISSHECIIQTDEEAMRGVDYRSTDGSGIKLLLARDFPSERAFVQALGRVGRYLEPCERFIQEGLTPVNKNDAIATFGKIR